MAYVCLRRACTRTVAGGNDIPFDLDVFGRGSGHEDSNEINPFGRVLSRRPPGNDRLNYCVCAHSPLAIITSHPAGPDNRFDLNEFGEYNIKPRSRVVWSAQCSSAVH